VISTKPKELLMASLLQLGYIGNLFEIVIKSEKAKVDLERILVGAQNHEKIQQYKNPNVLTFYEWMETDSSVFIVTEVNF
jgi:hypothetical protein